MCGWDPEQRLGEEVVPEYKLPSKPLLPTRLPPPNGFAISLGSTPDWGAMFKHTRQLGGILYTNHSINTQA